MNIRVKEILFYLLVFTLPFNLGKHFVFGWSYVNGLLTDYLIPTLYLQDVLIISLLLLWFIEIVKRKRTLVDLGWISRFLFIFLFTILLSSISSINPAASVFGFLRLALYILFSFYIVYNFDWEKEIPKLIKVLILSVLFIEGLSILQWLKQGSIFNNYLFFGEQPYGYSTFGISKESFFGRTVIPPYATFRHPNILAGFLSIVLVWIYGFRGVLKDNFFERLMWLVVVLGVLVLFLSFSFVAIIAFFIGIVLIHVLKRNRKALSSKGFLIILLPFLLISIFLPVITTRFFSDSPSFYRRVNLYSVASQTLKSRYLFGVGYNSSTELSGKYLNYFDEFKHPQPVHNIFLLTFLESGVFALLFFSFFLVFMLTSRKLWVNVTVLQFVILGLFDHYVVTIHQTSLLFWITVGLFLSSMAVINNKY